MGDGGLLGGKDDHREEDEGAGQDRKGGALQMEVRREAHVGGYPSRLEGEERKRLLKMAGSVLRGLDSGKVGPKIM